MFKASKIGLLLLAFLIVSPLRSADLPPGAYAILGSDRLYHGPKSLDAVFSPDGTRIASTSRYSHFSRVSERAQQDDAGAVVLWDASTGQRLREFRVSDSWLSRPVFSKDGQRLAACAEKRVVIFEVETGRITRTIPEKNWLGAMHFSADGQRLYACKAHDSVLSFDIATGKQLKQWTGPKAPSKWLKKLEYVSDFYISPHQKFIVWHVDEMPDYSKLPPDVIVGPHISRPEFIIVTDMASDKILYRKNIGREALRRFVFSANGDKYFVGEKDVRAYQTATGQEQLTLEVAPAQQVAHSELFDWSVSRITPSPDEKHIVCSSGWSDVHVWSLETKKPVLDLSPGLVNLHWRSCDYSGDGKTIMFTSGSTIRLFDAETGRDRKGIGHSSPPVPRFSSDGKALLTTCSEETCTWNLSNKASPTLASRESRKPWEDWTCEYNRDRSAFLRRPCHQRPSDKIQILDTATGRELTTMEDIKDTHFGLLSSDASRVILWNWADINDLREGVRLFDGKTGKKTGDLKIETSVRFDPMFSPDGKFVALANHSHGVTLYDSITGKAAAKLESTTPLEKNECKSASLVFSPDSQYLVIVTHGHSRFVYKEELENWYTFPARVFHIPTKREVGRFYLDPVKKSNGEMVECAAISNDNRLLAIADQEFGAIRVLDLSNGKILVELNGHRHGVKGLAFSPDNATLASGGMDNVVYLWDMAKYRDKK